MANTIILKKSSVAARVPVVGDLQYGELAINYTDGKLYYKTASNTIASFSAASSASSTWIKKTTTYTASTGDQIIADTSGGAFTISLPPSPSVGNSVIFADAANWYTTNLTVARNGSTIEGVADDLILNIKGITVTLIYDGTTWSVFAATVPEGLSVVADTSTNATMYPTWVQNSSGVNQTPYSSTNFYFNPSTGSVSATNFDALSDISLKDNVLELNSTLSMLEKIRPVSFNWKDNGIKAYGVIAQELETSFPDLVQTNSTSGLKTVSYTQLIPFLIQAVKELSAEIACLKDKVAE